MWHITDMLGMGAPEIFRFAKEKGWLPSFLGGKKPAQDGIVAAAGGVGPNDEYLALAAYFHDVDLERETVTKAHQEVITGICARLVAENRKGAAKKFYAIIGLKESEVADEIFYKDDEAIDDQDPKTKKNRRRASKKVTRIANLRGARLIIGFGNMGKRADGSIDVAVAVAKSMELLDSMTLLDNPDDKTAKTKVWLEEKAKEMKANAAKWWNDHEVETAESLALKILGANRFARAMADPVIVRTKQAYLAAPDGADKAATQKGYLDALNDLVRAYVEPKYIRRYGNPGEHLFSERKSQGPTAIALNIFVLVAVVGLIAAAVAVLY